MSTLSDLVIATDTVTYGSQSFEVRGIGFNDVTALLAKYGDEVNRLVDSFSGKSLATDDVMDAIKNASISPEQIIGEIPNVICMAIALACDDPGNMEKVKRLPISVQVDAAIKIWNLTVEAAGGFPKLMDSLITAMGAIKQQVEKLPTGTPTSQAA